MTSLEDECPHPPNLRICDWQFLYFTTGAYKDLSIYECKTCGLKAQFPRVEQSMLYEADYYQGKAEYTYIDERETERFHKYVWDARLRNIQKFIPTGTFLDVGSSFGGFLRAAQKKGYKVQGVEISSYASLFAKDSGIPTVNCSLLETKFAPDSFDVITLIEVIEHLENPKLVFQELTRILKPGGLLLLQTANFEGWQAKDAGPSYHYYMPGHLFYYSNSVLKKILTPLGFDRFICYFGVDFSLLSKLKKSRGNFKHWYDYRHWIRISFYHFKSKLSKAGFPLTSSYVLYAFKSR